MRYLILGCGPAGIAAAKAVRKAKKDAEIVIATDEFEAPYLRPLLPDFILGDADRDAIEDPQGKDLSDAGITVRQRIRVTRVDTGNRKASFSDGSDEAYDVLLIATGGKPGVPPPLRKELGALLSFDSLGDAVKIKERAKQPGPAVVYGPGYLAIEACRALRKAKRDVIWIQPDLPRSGYPIGGELEASILDDVRNRGAKILDGDDVVHVWGEEGEGPCVVYTRSGQEIRSSLVVVATERVPAVEFLAGSGVMVGTGALVDDTLKTSVPNVYAAGDCAEFVADKASGTTKINFGWRSAIRQGQLAGENMAGAGKKFPRNEEDYFWVLFGFPLRDRAK